MNKEIEIKLLFKNKKKILDILGKTIKFKKKTSYHDIYFGKKGSNMSNTHSLIRLRIDNQNKTAELTYKGKAKNKKNIWCRVELNTIIEDAKIMAMILNNIGLEKISEYKNTKEYYSYQNMELCFAKFILPAKLSFMEVEGPNEIKIKQVVKKMGRDVKEVGEEIFQIFDKIRKNKK